MAEPQAPRSPPPRWRALEPLREPDFRTIWLASVLANLGQLIQGVGAAWQMTHLTPSPTMVALVQSALMLPLMLVAVPAGAMADMFDRRKVAMAGLAFATAAAALLTLLSALGLVSPWMLLGFCSLIGGGVALYGPAWQASVAETVHPDRLPAAVALGSVSYNLARSVGPALGGILVVALGATAAFATNALCYLPLLLAFFLWRRRHVPPRLPPERIGRAIVSGARYAIHSPPIRTVVVRSFVSGLAGASTAALAPLLARDQLQGDATTYGLLLCATGVGAVFGALLTSEMRERLRAEGAVRLCALIAGALIVLIGLSHNLVLTLALTAVCGAAYIQLIALLNVGVQLSAPRWVTARALTWFTASLTGGIALGAWLWGALAGEWGVGGALIASGIALALSPLLGVLMPMPEVSLEQVRLVELSNEPEVALPLTARSGPVVIEIDYRVAPDEARRFYEVMLGLQHARLRNGAFDWSLARDIADPELWTERYHCPTWGDYLHMRGRFTLSDRDLQARADAFSTPGAPRRVRRRLERPFGSVRSSPDVPETPDQSVRLP